MSYDFGIHLKQCGLVAQLTPPGTPQCNGVFEHRNRTLLDMVRSMMSVGVKTGGSRVGGPEPCV